MDAIIIEAYTHDYNKNKVRSRRLNMEADKRKRMGIAPKKYYKKPNRNLLAAEEVL